MPRVVRTPASFSAPIARPAQFAPRFAYQGVRLYSAPAGLDKNEVEGRIVNLLKNFDKVRRNSHALSLSVPTGKSGEDYVEEIEDNANLDGWFIGQRC